MAQAFTVNVVAADEAQAMIDAAIAAYGRVDILCNAAGIGSTTDVVEAEPEEYY